MRIYLSKIGKPEMFVIVCFSTTARSSFHHAHTNQQKQHSKKHNIVQIGAQILLRNTIYCKKVKEHSANQRIRLFC